MTETPREQEQGGDDTPPSGIGGLANADQPATSPTAGAAAQADADRAQAGPGTAQTGRGPEETSDSTTHHTGASTTQTGPGSSQADPGSAQADPGGAQTGGTQSDPGAAQTDASATQSGGGTQSGAGRTRSRTARRRMAFAPVVDADPATEEGRRQRRRRQFFVAGISVAAAVIVIALCAGALGIASAIDGFRDRAADARETRQQRDAACLELEQRLNRLTPPGAATTPQARAKAVRDENTAVRIYVLQNNSARDQDAWRQLLDARTAYAESLDQQVKTRTPAFYVAPRTDDGSAVADELVHSSPAPCAGPIRRLATPDL